MLSNLAMELTPLQNLNQDNLAGLILQMRRQMEAQAKRIEELESELKELRKKNPTQRLDEAYSVKAEEKRREDAQQTGKPKKKKQKSKRRGRITTAEKLAAATQEEHVWPAEHVLQECTRRYARIAWRTIDGQAVPGTYHIYAGADGRVPQIPGVPKRGEFGSPGDTALNHAFWCFFGTSRAAIETAPSSAPESAGSRFEVTTAAASGCCPVPTGPAQPVFASQF